MITINETLNLIVLLVDLLIDNHTDITLVIDIDLDLTPRNNIITKYTSSFRHPSTPRDPQNSRSRSHTTTRNKNNTIQAQTSNDHINFKIHMYHPTEIANALTPTSWFYSQYLPTPKRQKKHDYPSR